MIVLKKANKMKNFFDYLFYHLYKRQRTWYSEKFSVIAVSILVVAFSGINLAILALVFFYEGEISMQFTLLIMLFVIVAFGWSLFYFRSKKRYLQIINSYGNTSRKRINRYRIYLVTYIIVFAALFFISVFGNR